MSPMPEYSDEDLSPTTETKMFTNGLMNNSKISPIIEENGSSDNNESPETEKICTNGKNHSDNQNGNLNAEVGVEITETATITEVSMKLLDIWHYIHINSVTIRI